MVMRLIETVETPGSLNNFGIYELGDELSSKYGGKYFLSQGIIRDKLLTELDTCDGIIHRALYTLAGYDDIYQTQLEAHMAAKLVCQQSVIDTLKYKIKELSEYKIPDITWNIPKEKE